MTATHFSVYTRAQPKSTGKAYSMPPDASSTEETDATMLGMFFCRDSLHLESLVLSSATIICLWMLSVDVF